MMKNIHVLLGIMCMHSAAHAMLSSCVPRSVRRVMNEFAEGMVTSQSTQKEKQTIVAEQLEQNDQLVFPSDWQHMYSILEGKYQDYLKDQLKECKETHVLWDMDKLVNAGRIITKQDDATLKTAICATYDEHGFTFAHTLIEDPDKLFELIKQNYIAFAHNKHNFSALDYAIKNLERYTQNADHITLDPEGFERASCSVYILLNYVKMRASRYIAERATADDFGSCCEKHTFVELDFIESKQVYSDMLDLLDEYLKPLEEEESEEEDSSLLVSCHYAESAMADGLQCEEPVMPVAVDVMEKKPTHIVVLSDEHMTSRVTNSTKSKPTIGAFVSFGEHLKPLKGEPKKGSMVIVKDHDCYLWGLVRGRPVHNNIGVVCQQEGNGTYGKIFSLEKLYELV